MDSTDVTTPTPAQDSTADAPAAVREWVSPGVSVRKRWLTGAGVALAALVFFTIALTQGANMVVSTAIGVVFIGCFVWYLRIVAPEPFTIRLDSEGVRRIGRGAEAEAEAEESVISWDRVAKVKEELFKNGTSVSITVYKRVGERGLHRAWVAYRDDLPHFDDLVEAMRARLPQSTPWIGETVHE
jgi:hypothetical protein